MIKSPSPVPFHAAWCARIVACALPLSGCVDDYASDETTTAAAAGTISIPTVTGTSSPTVMGTTTTSTGSTTTSVSTTGTGGTGGTATTVASTDTAGAGTTVSGTTVSAPTTTTTTLTISSSASPDSANTVISGEMRWSDPATWGGTLPAAGAEIVIPAGRTVILDTQTASLGRLRIDGTLRFVGDNVALTAASIQVTGALLAGAPGVPFTGRAVVTLTGAPVTPNDGIARGLVVNGGELFLYSAAPAPAWTKLAEHAESGVRSLTLKDAVNWQSGDSIVVAPTEYYGVAQTERLELAAAGAGARV
jgi:hypothetical protein